MPVNVLVAGSQTSRKPLSAGRVVPSPRAGGTTIGSPSAGTFCSRAPWASRSLAFSGSPRSPGALGPSSWTLTTVPSTTGWLGSWKTSLSVGRWTPSVPCSCTTIGRDDCPSPDGSPLPPVGGGGFGPSDSPAGSARGPVGRLAAPVLSKPSRAPKPAPCWPDVSPATSPSMMISFGSGMTCSPVGL